eukprot:9486681-Pyramimonas_sp.AAC.2
MFRTRRGRGYRGFRPGHVQTWQLNWHRARRQGPSFPDAGRPGIEYFPTTTTRTCIGNLPTR